MQLQQTNFETLKIPTTNHVLKLPILRKNVKNLLKQKVV
jgi:hypothetical protein